VLATIGQTDFVARYWAPSPGQHVTLIGPTGCGKTTLGIQLLASAAGQHPGTRGVVLAMKPHRGPKALPVDAGRRARRLAHRRTGDETVSRLTRELGGRIVRSWPPPPVPRAPFYTLWPKHSFDIDQDTYSHYEAFRGAINHEYQHGNSWIFADEIYSLSHELKLDKELVRVLTKGRSMRCSMMSATQRPAHIPLWAYSEASHFFLWRMRDRGALDRLREIGNVDRDLVVSTLARLGRHDCLYLCPPDNVMAVLVPDTP
jgi:energy-coupling factor transporter ATP-binding protein EcfA2